MPTSNSSESSTPQVLFKKRRTATYGLLTLLGTGALVLLNQTTSSEASLTNWLADELAPSAQVISTEIAQTLPPAARNTNFIADAVEQVGPSVVRI
ncbi:MAG: hypothetical protein AAGF98_09130, partial [Cyanobacteria bacterium P01_H01_bin.153]